MIKKIISFYSFKYPRSIVYMLQSSEYNIFYYLKLFFRVENVNNVEIRKSLVRTTKATLLLVIAWFINILAYISLLYILLTNYNFKYLIAFVIFILVPHILSFGIIIPLLLIEFFIQKPIEYFIIRKAHEKLKKHIAIKIAVAGSFGKTTMREILKTVLGEGKIVSAPPENHNTLLGISNFIKTLKGNEEILIFELGEYYKGDIKEMCELVNPDIGIITGINEAHLDKFKSLDVTVGTIFELSDWLKNKPLYINAENKLAKENALKNNIFYSRDGIEDFKIENTKTDINGTSFTLIKNNDRFDFHSKLLGLHQIGPLVLAVNLALLFEIPIEKIQSGIDNTKPFKHRLNPSIDKNGVITIDDSYNGNPDGVKAVIKFLESLKGHRRFYVTPGLVEMGSRTEIVHREIGIMLAQAKIEKIVLVKNSVTPFIEKGLKESNYQGDIIWFGDGLKALNSINLLTVNRDVVLLQNDWPDQYY